MSNSEEEISSGDHFGNLTAVDAISERLAEVTRLAQKLDESLYEAGAKLRTPSKQLSDYVTGNAAFIKENVECEEKNEEGDERVVDGEGSCTEDYVTATECTTTPIARSRSESFVTMSECDDGLVAEFSNARQEAVEELRRKREAANTNFITVPSAAEIDKDKTIVSRSLEMAEKRENSLTDPDIERTSATSIIEKIEEKSGKIVKEVTETTTLRVSHDTRFGVASYKLISNTLREAHDHTDLKGILDAKGFGVKTNGCGNGDDKFLHKDEFSKYNREELSHSDVDAVPGKLENGHHSKFTKIIRESSQREDRTSQIMNDTSNAVKLISLGLDVRGNNASGIEMTPRKNGDLVKNYEEPEDLELLRKMKRVSRSQVVVEDSTITNLRTIH